MEGILWASDADLGAREADCFAIDRAGQAQSERLHRIVQRPLPRRMPERALVHKSRARSHSDRMIEGWRREYNDERPKRALGGLTPSQYARQLAQKAVTLTA